MSHLLYLMFRCDFDVMKNLEILREVNTAHASKRRGPQGNSAINLVGVPSAFLFAGSQALKERRRGVQDRSSKITLIPG